MSHNLNLREGCIGIIKQMAIGVMNGGTRSLD